MERYRCFSPSLILILRPFFLGAAFLERFPRFFFGLAFGGGAAFFDLSGGGAFLAFGLGGGGAFLAFG